jgi:hypothetical protein
VFRKDAIAILHSMWAQITAFKSSPFPAARAEHCHFDRDQRLLQKRAVFGNEQLRLHPRQRNKTGSR